MLLLYARTPRVFLVRTKEFQPGGICCRLKFRFVPTLDQLRQPLPLLILDSRKMPNVRAPGDSDAAFSSCSHAISVADGLGSGPRSNGQGAGPDTFGSEPLGIS